MINSSLVFGVLLVLGPLALVTCIAYGVLGFNPDRATAIRNGEAQQPVVMEEIRRIHIRSPERFRHERLDRHPTYIGLHLAVWMYAWCVFAGAPVTSNISALSPGTKLTMATCFLIGSTLVLSGSLMGARIGRWTVLHGVRDNLTSSMLADDIRLPYTFGAAGMIAVGVSMGIYAKTSFGSTLGSLGGWMTALAGAAPSAILLWLYVSRIQRYGRARTTLITEAVAQIERGHGID